MQLSNLFFLGEQKSFHLLIKNTGSDPVILRQIEMLHACNLFKLSDQFGVARGERFVRVLSGKLSYSSLGLFFLHLHW